MDELKKLAPNSPSSGANVVQKPKENVPCIPPVFESIYGRFRQDL